MTTFTLRRLASALIVLFGTGILAAALPQAQIGSYTAQNNGKITQPAPPTLTEDPLYESASYPAYEMELADGPGRAEVQIYCNTCHTARYILMQPPLPAATWDAEVQKMIKVLGAPIPEADAAKITKYLQEHYTPETRK